MLGSDRCCVVQVFVSSVFLGFAFMFGNSVRNLFEAVIFIFIVHPFDTGNALIIDNLLYVVRAHIHTSCGMHTPAPWDDLACNAPLCTKCAFMFLRIILLDTCLWLISTALNMYKTWRSCDVHQLAAWMANATASVDL